MELIIIIAHRLLFSLNIQYHTYILIALKAFAGIIFDFNFKIWIWLCILLIHTKCSGSPISGNVFTSIISCLLFLLSVCLLGCTNDSSHDCDCVGTQQIHKELHNTLICHLYQSLMLLALPNIQSCLLNLGTFHLYFHCFYYSIIFFCC